MRETQESSNPIRPRIPKSSDGGLKGIEEEQLEKDKKENNTNRFNKNRSNRSKDSNANDNYSNLFFEKKSLENLIEVQKTSNVNKVSMKQQAQEAIKKNLANNF